MPQSFASNDVFYVVFLLFYFATICLAVWWSSTNVSTTLYQQIGMFMLLVVPALFFLVSSTNSLMKSWSSISNTNGSNNTNGSSASNGLLPHLVLVVVFAGIIYACVTIIDHLPSTFVLLYIVLATLIVVIGVAIIYELLQHLQMHVNMRTGVSPLGFLAKLIYFIPCLFLDILRALNVEIESTSDVTFLAVFLELALLLSFVYFQQFLTSANLRGDGIQIINEPLHLEWKQTHATAANIIPKITPAAAVAAYGAKPPAVYPIRFAISLWVFINQRGSNNLAYQSPTNVFRFGDPSMVEGGHPMLSFGGNTFRVYCNNDSSDKNYSEITVPTGKWTFWTFNYTDTTMDVFVDARLAASLPLSASVDTQSISDNDAFIVGEESGLSGAVCNVVYYPHTVSDSDIRISYGLLKNSSPPVASVQR